MEKVGEGDRLEKGRILTEDSFFQQLSSRGIALDLTLPPYTVGINLTAASHVFLMEPCLNPALEEQAIGRSWRMGQQRAVVVKRFYTKVCGGEGGMGGAWLYTKVGRGQAMPLLPVG